MAETASNREQATAPHCARSRAARLRVSPSRCRCVLLSAAGLALVPKCPLCWLALLSAATGWSAAPAAHRLAAAVLAGLLVAAAALLGRRGIRSLRGLRGLHPLRDRALRRRHGST